MPSSKPGRGTRSPRWNHSSMSFWPARIMGNAGRVIGWTLCVMLTAMARELVTKNGVGESAAAVWRQIQAENSDLLNATIVPPEPVPVAQDAAPTTPLVTAALTIETIEALKFGTRPPAVRPVTRRREAPPADLQFPLF